MRAKLDFMGRVSLIQIAILMLILARVGTLPILPLIDPTEGRYAAVASDMLASGDYVTPMIWMRGEHVPFLGKPPLQFWATALTLKLFGHNEFATRFPSFVFGLLLAGLLYQVMKRVHTARVAGLSVVMLLSCPFFLALSGAVALDMGLALASGGALLAFYAFLHHEQLGGRVSWSLLIGALLGVGMLAKGPVALIWFGFPVTLYFLISRDWKTLARFGWTPSVTLFFLIATPWYLICERHNPGFLKYFLINENVLRYFVADYGDRYGKGHVFPFGMAAVFFLGGAFPWILAVAIPWLRRKDEGLRARIGKGRESLLFYAAFSVILLLCFAHQLTWTYVLPALPLFAAWAALQVESTEAAYRKAARLGIYIGVLFVPVSFGWHFAHALASSPRGVLRMAEKRLASDPSKKGIRFASVPPYSALFYGKQRLRTERTEYDDLLDHESNDLLIIATRHWHRVPDATREQLTIDSISGDWILASRRKEVALNPVADHQTRDDRLLH